MFTVQGTSTQNNRSRKIKDRSPVQQKAGESYIQHLNCRSSFFKHERDRQIHGPSKPQIQSPDHLKAHGRSVNDSINKKASRNKPTAEPTMPSLAAANLDLSTCRQTSITAYKTAKVPASRSKKRSIKSSWPGLGKKCTAEQHKKHGRT